MLVCSRERRTRIGRVGSGTEVRVAELGPGVLPLPIARVPVAGPPGSPTHRMVP